MSAAVIALLQARFDALAGVKTAPTRYPSVPPQPADLPCVITEAREGATQWDAHGGASITETRTYVARFLVQASGLDTLDGAKQDALTLLDAVLEDLRETPKLSATVAVLLERADGLRDSGVRPSGTQGPVLYGGESYTGFEVTMVAEETYE